MRTEKEIRERIEQAEEEISKLPLRSERARTIYEISIKVLKWVLGE